MPPNGPFYRHDRTEDTDVAERNASRAWRPSRTHMLHGIARDAEDLIEGRHRAGVHAIDDAAERSNDQRGLENEGE